MQLQQFSELFNPLPGNCYLHVTTQINEINTLLHTMLQKVGGELHVAYYGADENDMETVEAEKKQYIDSFEKPFRALPRDHDIVVFENILHQHNKPQQLLKIAYTTLANAAHIIILEPKGTMDIEGTMEMLDALEYRTPNYIDILPEYDLIMAKKLHMWGNGL